MLSACGSGLLCLATFCFLIGGVMFITRGMRTANRVAQTMAAARPTARQAARPRPAQSSSAPPPVVQKSGDSVQAKFANVRLGQTLMVNHPQRGSLTGQILGTIQYTELWQTGTGAYAPWTPTGNVFTAHWLGNWMMYEWQGRLYLFDEAVALSDQDIQQQFMPYAKQFAQSNQTAKVTFAWPPATWTIADIGKFRVEQAEGTGLRLNVGAEGRFIHATGADQRALVVEDYQSGSGGQDTAWLGWQVTWEAVTQIG
jgi:hypothetical protein